MANGHFKSCTSPSLRECWCEIRRYVLAFTIGLVIFAAQGAGGWYFNSLALWTGSGHVATDLVAYGIAMYVGYRARSLDNSAGLRKSGMVWSTIALIGFLGYVLLVEVPERLAEPPEVQGAGLLAVAAAGAFGNYLQHRIMSGGEKHDTTHGLSLHPLADLVSSIGVVVAGILVLVTGWPQWDIIATVLIIGWLAWNAYGLLADRHDHNHTH